MTANFIEVNSLEKLESVIAGSHSAPVIFFKHSRTCGISASLFNRVSSLDADINLIIVQDARSISNEIAERTGIRHESPQAIVLDSGLVKYHASHYDIDIEEIAASLSKN